MAKRRRTTVSVEGLSLGGTKPPVGVTVGEMLAEMAEPLKLSAVEDNAPASPSPAFSPGSLIGRYKFWG
jgi:hypothetical protein